MPSVLKRLSRDHFLDEWISYRGQGRRGFRENTATKYRRLIAKYARPYFSGKRQIVPPKTKYGWREVRLPVPLIYQLRSHLAAQTDQDSPTLGLPTGTATWSSPTTCADAA